MVVERALAIALYAALACGCRSEPVEAPRRSFVINIHADLDFPYCPVITGLNAAPLDVIIGGEIELTAVVLEGLPEVEWSSSSSASTFDDPRSLDVRYRCMELGEHTLTLIVEGERGCTDRGELPITCERSARCGDGERTPEEQCDDGDLEPLDGCSELCLLEVF